MSDLVCFKHRLYRGEQAPDLSCKTCCTIFIHKIKEEQLARKSAKQSEALADAPKQSNKSG